MVWFMFLFTFVSLLPMSLHNIREKEKKKLFGYNKILQARFI